jgi:hypothetical protein
LKMVNTPKLFSYDKNKELDDIVTYINI